MIETTLTNGILQIVFTRPARKNAFTDAMYSTLSGILSEAEDNPAVLVAILSGAGGCFSAGNDLDDFLQHPPSGPNAPAFIFLRTLAGFSKPVIAAVEGMAVGIGATMLLHCDLIYAQADARLIFPFISLGLVPEGASTLLLPRQLGHPRAAEILFFGEPVTADRALSLGLINQVITDGPVLAHACARAQALTTRAQGALRATKALLKATPHASNADPAESAILQHIDHEAEVFARRVQSTAAREAFTAFAEKRAPDFSGLD